jgi:Type II secretion system (T2SS), protein M
MIQLTRRERRLGIGMATVGILWAMYGFVIQPMRDRIHTLQRVIPEKQAELKKIQAKSDEYIKLRREVEDARARMADQDADFQLLPFLESLIERHKLAPYVVTMERNTPLAYPGYSETVVDSGLEGIGLGQLVRFLNAVETSGALVHIGTLYIRKDATNPALLSSTVQIRSPRLTQNAVAADLARP